jgi:tRNA-dihydrouridine synthase B
MSNTLILAPMHGLTDAIYRNTHHKHFGAFDEMMAPYVLAHGDKPSRPNHLKKLLNHNTSDYRLVPQILGNEPNAIILYTNQFYSIGYEEINWNLGCPYEFVTKKKRGSGLLPYPENINSILSKVLPNIQGKFSVKIRLGLHSRVEIFEVLKVLNDFPVSEIIIHPRTGDQKYDGEVYLEDFNKYLELSNHNIVYNGDIDTVQKFNEIKRKFPSISRWMIGRGALSNPLLPSIIKAKAPNSFVERSRLFWDFHDNLFQNYRSNTSKELVVLNRMKEFWSMMSNSFENSDQLFNEIKTSITLVHFTDVINAVKEKYDWLG